MTLQREQKCNKFSSYDPEKRDSTPDWEEGNVIKVPQLSLGECRS